MKNRKIAALSLAFTILLLSACNKDNYPGTLPDQKITNIYETSTFKTEMLNPVTQEWKVIVEKTNARHLAHEFTELEYVK